MRIREWVVNQKELLAIGAVIGTVSIVGAVRGFSAVTPATAPVAAVREAADTSATRADVQRLTQDVSVVAARVNVVSVTVDALLRVECIGNVAKWPQFELAGIHCSELVPSTVQAGQVRGHR